MKKIILTAILLMLIAALTLSLSACDFAGLLSGLTGEDGEGGSFEYDSDYITEHLTGDYTITYKVTFYSTGEAPAVSNQKITRTSAGYYFETRGTSEGEVEEESRLYVKTGSEYYLYQYNEDDDIYVLEHSTPYDEETMKQQVTAYMSYLSMHSEQSGLKSDGTDTVAGRSCDKYKYSISLLGMAGMAYSYSIDKETGVCLKYAIDVSGGGQKTGYEFLCTEFNTTSAVLPEFALAQTAPGKVAGITAVVGDGEVTLSWTAGSNGGSPITGYELTYDNWATTITKTANELTHTFTGLTNGDNYTFRIRVINAKGTGEPTAKTAQPKASETSNPDDGDNGSDDGNNSEIGGGSSTDDGEND
jgi:hypothetical protein